jgi:hypothetical protein
MEKVTDRLALGVLRLVATAMLFAGMAVLVAGVPLFGMLIESPLVRTVAGILLQISAVFVVGGGAALYLSRRHGPLLVNEHAETSEAERPAVGGWLIALAITLVMLPVWLVLRLQPFLAEWGRVIDFLATLDIWQGANANGSGLILLPLFAALTPPFFELAAMSAFVVASAALFALLLLRSPRFPRIYLVCVVLLSALVIASVRGADAAMSAVDAVRQLIENSNPRAEEAALLSDSLIRYTSVVGSTAPVLVWALCAYLIWVPGMISSGRARETFAKRARDEGAIDLEAITRPPRFSG